VISRQKLLELAAELKIPAKECDLQAYDTVPEQSIKLPLFLMRKIKSEK